MQFQESKFSRTIPFGKIEGVAYANDNMTIGYNSTKFEKETTLSSSDKKDVVRLHFGLKGDYRFSYKQLNQSYDLIGGHYNLMYSPEFDITVSNKTAEINTFGISFDRSYFLNLIHSDESHLLNFKEKVANGKAIMLYTNWGAIDASMESLFRDIIQGPFKGNLRDSFLQSRSMELFLAATHLPFIQKKNNFIKVKADKEKIIAARDYINAKYIEAPNLSEVSKYVGLNEYKLKHGFKEIFGSTLFGYMTECRWQEAKRLLLDTKISSAEISNQLGYATPQHFNNRFKMRFGQTPTVFRNNPKNAIVYSTN